jgi:hypothetical protein
MVVPDILTGLKHTRAWLLTSKPQRVLHTPNSSTRRCQSYNIKGCAAAIRNQR